MNTNESHLPPEARARLILVTGLSGSGKSYAANCLEDLGFYVVDNLPLPLLRSFVQDPVAQVGGHYRRIAVVTDVRAHGFAQELPELLQSIDRSRVMPTVVFLEASEEALIRRFSETRRPHPLAGSESAVQGIRREREELAEIRGLSDLVLDTTNWSVHQLRGHIYQEFAEDLGAGLVVSLTSFGFKHGIPHGSDLLFDLRYLPNPYFVPGLREHTGLEQPVHEFLHGQDEFVELVARLEDLLLYLLPKYRRENRTYLSVSIGCTGGKHRSVAAVAELAARLEKEGWGVRTMHRDLGR